MKLAIYLTTLLLIVATQAHAQKSNARYTYSLGAKYFTYRDYDDFSALALTYAPRVNFFRGSNTSLSVGARVAVGIGWYDDYSGKEAVGDLPILAEYNFGYDATNASIKKVGGYIGAGAGIHWVTNFEYSEGWLGPVLSGGLRFNTGKLGAYELGATYHIDIDRATDGSNTFAISLSYMAGSKRKP